MTNEAPISGNVRLYYKGYSIQITCRDPQEEIKPLIEKMMQIADFADTHNCQPSWNDDTNKKAAQPTSGLTRPCPVHGDTMTERLSKKTGKPYFAHSTPEGLCFGKVKADEFGALS